MNTSVPVFFSVVFFSSIVLPTVPIFMAGFHLELPTIQNWSCHQCGDCCRHHAIELSDEERQRITSQNWTAEDGLPAETPTIVPYAGPPWKKRYRLGNQPDGACVFLADDGLCKIHAKFGEAAKPLACRIYPFTFHPDGKRLAVGFRYSCPSVVDNLGTATQKRRRELRDYAEDALPKNADQAPPPKISQKETVDWHDFHRFKTAIVNSLSDKNRSFTHRLLHTLKWLDIVEQATFRKIKGAQLTEFLNLIVAASADELPDDLRQIDTPSNIGFTQFRLLVSHYAQKETFADRNRGLKNRWKRFTNATRFAKGNGNIPVVQTEVDGFRELPFSTVETDFGGYPDDAEELLERFFRVKVETVHFCGLAYYGFPFIEGFRSLAMLFPSVLWIARWRAASDGRKKLTRDDIATALSLADHHHGFSPAFGSFAFRKRIQLMTRTNDLVKLIAWSVR